MSTVSYPLITRDAILDGMVAALADVTIESTGGFTPDRFLRSVDRYMGELRNVEAFKRGVAGRCPAVRVAFVSDRSIRTTIGRRTDHVEAQFACVVFSDHAKSKDDRSVLLNAVEKVQRLLSSRALGLKIKPLRHRSTQELSAIEHCTAYTITFTTRYRIDYTVSPGADIIASATGEITNAETTMAPRPHAPTLSVVGDAGTASHSYLIVALDADGLPSLRGDEATITTAPDALDSDNLVRVAWASVPNAASYQVVRTASDNLDLGIIGTASSLSLDDTGQVATTLDPEPVYQGLEMEFA